MGGPLLTVRRLRTSERHIKVNVCTSMTRHDEQVKPSCEQPFSSFDKEKYYTLNSLFQSHNKCKHTIPSRQLYECNVLF